MPPEEQGLDLEQLKVDPRVWQRLATPLEGSNVLGNVFVDEKENPFQKDPKGSMEKIQSLAAAGKLYLRDLGRSRHFHKVEKDGDNLKLGEKHEMKLSNRNIDLPLSILMWATGKYLRSWGLESIPNWFDKKREERAAINKMEAQYKEEYKSFTSEQKKELKELRKQEKQEAKEAKQEAKLQKKLDKLKKEAEKTQKKLDKLKNKNQEKNEEKAKKKAKKKTEKKTGRKNKKEIKEKETDPLQKEIDKEAQELQDFLDAPDIEKEVKELEDFLDPPENPNLDKETGPLIEEEAPHDLLGGFDDVVPQTQPDLNEQPIADLTAPLQNPPDLEAGQVNMQPQEESPQAAAVRNRLAQEKDALDVAEKWRDTAENVLFSHDEAEDLRNTYTTMKGAKDGGREYLTGVLFGTMQAASADPAKMQQVMDALLAGRALGSENDELVRNGASIYTDAIQRKTDGYDDRMSEMLSNAVKDLSQQATKESKLSPRHIMIGKLISAAVEFAENNNIKIALTETELQRAQGASNLARVAQDYFGARQFLGSGNVDINQGLGRAAVNGMLAGMAVNSMLQKEAMSEQGLGDTQMIMGYGLWTSENLQEMANCSAERRLLGKQQINNLLEKPDSLAAFCTGSEFSKEIMGESMGLSQQKNYTREREMEAQQPQRQSVDLLQFG